MVNINWELLKDLVGYAPDKYDRYKKKKHIPHEIRQKIWERDKVCRVCGKENTFDSEGNSRLHIHHIDPKGESSEDNLILLCKYCHQTVHCLLFVTNKGAFVNVLRVIRW